jgi:signal peptidase
VFIRRVLAVGGQAVVVVAVVALVLGSVLGQPILLGFVETGSMEPTLNPGDGFVAIPTQLAGPVEEGDVVVFRAEEIQGGGLTTHRVVGETERGFITRGDANPFTDQDNEEPPVKRAQIVAVAWQPGGGVVAIPALGSAVGWVTSVIDTVQRRLAILLGSRSLLGTQGLAYLLFAASMLLYAFDVWRESDRDDDRKRSRSRSTGTNTRLAIAAMAGILVLAATVAMVAPAGAQQSGVVSAEFDSPGARVVEQGTSETRPYAVRNGGLLPAAVFLEPGSDMVAVEPREARVAAGSTLNASVTITAPPETGYYRWYVEEHRYLAVLPQAHIRALYEVHPWLPILAIDALIGVPFYLLGVFLVGTGRVRRRSREGPSTTDRVLARLK